MGKAVQLIPLAGYSNSASVSSALSRLGYEVLLIEGRGRVSPSLPLVIPGVGTFGGAMTYLRETGLDQEITAHGGIQAQIVGICLGFQILFEKGTEGTDSGQAGLGLLPGTVHPLHIGNKRETNIGWHELSDGVQGDPPSKVYFCHSYHVESPVMERISVELGDIQLLAIARLGGIQGFQFHPELSGPSGMVMLARALERNTSPGLSGLSALKF